MRSLKAKGNATKFLETGEVEGSETFGMSDEQWGPISDSSLIGSLKKGYKSKFSSRRSQQSRE
jgi:hypothetical protein